MFEKKLGRLYVEVAQLVNKMIPTEWDEFWLSADLDEDNNGGVYFFYRDTDGNVNYSLDIPDDYTVSYQDYESSEIDLFNLIRTIKIIFAENNLAPWIQMTMNVNSERKLSVDFDYVDWFKSPFTTNDLIDYFEYKHFGNFSDNEEKLALFQKIEQYKTEN